MIILRVLLLSAAVYFTSFGMNPAQLQEDRKIYREIETLFKNQTPEAREKIIKYAQVRPDIVGYYIQASASIDPAFDALEMNIVDSLQDYETKAPLYTPKKIENLIKLYRQYRAGAAGKAVEDQPVRAIEPGRGTQPVSSVEPFVQPEPMPEYQPESGGEVVIGMPREPQPRKGILEELSEEVFTKYRE